MKPTTTVLIMACFLLQCQSQQWKPPLLEALEQAFLNETKNFDNLQIVFYPVEYVQTDTVGLGIKNPCDMTVRVIRNDGTDNPAFAKCYDCGCNDCYCLNSRLKFCLSETTNSQTYSKLKNYIKSGGLTDNIKFVDALSFLLFDVLTLSQLNNQSRGEPSTNSVLMVFNIEELDNMPTQPELVLYLKKLLIWVCG